MQEVTEGAEDYEDWGKEEKEEFGVVAMMETRMARMCRVRIIEACKNYELANLYPARVVAVGCLYFVMKEGGLNISDEVPSWLDNVTSGKVAMEDFEEVLVELRNT